LGVKQSISDVGNHPLLGTRNFFHFLEKIYTIFAEVTKGLSEDRKCAGTRARGQCHVRAGRPDRWHSHPLGQTLIVTAGCGRVQRWGGPIEEIRPGDVVWIPPAEKHWHGAAATTAMTHIAIQEQLDGKMVEWMEKVSDEQYGGK
jgi:mannose-6-phosphate isomerase-like protein (cupin superfamily)